MTRAFTIAHHTDNKTGIDKMACILLFSFYIILCEFSNLKYIYWNNKLTQKLTGTNNNFSYISFWLRKHLWNNNYFCATCIFQGGREGRGGGVQTTWFWSHHGVTHTVGDYVNYMNCVNCVLITLITRIVLNVSRMCLCYKSELVSRLYWFTSDFISTICAWLSQGW